MKDIRFLNTAFCVEMKNEGGNGSITYMELESAPVDRVKEWGITDPGEEAMELRLTTKSKFFELQRFQVKAKYPAEMVTDLHHFHGVDTQDLLYSTLNNEMDQNLLKNLYLHYSDLAETTRISEYTKWQKFILKWFKKIIITNYVEENIKGSESIYNRIVLEANKIASRTRIKPGDFVVCSSLIGSLLQDHPGFVWEPSKKGKIILNNDIISYVGNIAGRIEVYVNANLRFNDGYVIIGRKTNSHESGVYLPYKQREKFELASVGPSDTQIGISQRATIFNTPKAEKSFSKIHFTVGKKPFWRKLFNI